MLTDHDPNEFHYSKLEVDQLQLKLVSLTSEEDEARTAIQQRYESMREIIEKRIRDLKKRR